MTAYYNENDPKAAAWLRELINAGLITDGVVDERSVAEVQPADVAGHERVHFFAGIGGWDYALQLAGWPDDRPVWTGSCPCQPFSSAGKRKGTDDERHLWPEFKRLIEACEPQTIFGEQVASAEVVGTQLEADFFVAVQQGDYGRANKLAKRLVATKGFHAAPRWVDGIRADLEAAAYAFRSAILGAHSVGAPHIRQRLFWVADSTITRLAGTGQGSATDGERSHSMSQREGSFIESSGSGSIGRMGDTNSDRWEQSAELLCGRQLEPTWYGEGCGLPNSNGNRCDQARCRESETGGDGAVGAGGLAHTKEQRRRRRLAGASGTDNTGRGTSEADRSGRNSWSDYILIPCGDGKTRRIKPGLVPLAHGVSGRVGLLRGYGNAIVPEVAAEFIQAYQGVTTP